MDARLNDLLLDWELHREAGQPRSAVELCVDCPELLTELTYHIRLLESCNPIFAFDTLASTQEVGLEEPIPNFPGFEVFDELGKGGMGVVYKGMDQVLNRVVAIKTLRTRGVFFDRDLALRFRREGQVLAQLKHEHIVPIYEAKVHEGLPYLVMEYVSGGSLVLLRDKMVESGWDTVARFIVVVAEAVHYAHEQGVLHRDLKPSNILIDQQGLPRISDFGIAKLVNDPLEPISDAIPSSELSDIHNLTQSGLQPGTPAYMAPEQHDPTIAPVNRATDVWALGVILFEFLTGHRPFAGGSRQELCQAILASQPSFEKKSGRPIKGTLRNILLRCLQKDPARRFQTAQEFADALRTYRKRPRIIFGVGLCAVVMFIAWVSWYNNDERIYRKQIQPLLTRLKNGETINLVSSGDDMPAYAIRTGGDKVSVRKFEDGLQIQSSGLSVIEFLPRLPIPKYRIIAELAHTRPVSWPNGINGVGVTFLASYARTRAGDQQILGMLRYSDWDNTLQKQRIKNKGPTAPANLELFWWINPREGVRPQIELHGTVIRKQLYDYPIKFAELRSRRTIIIDVSPGEISANWGLLREYQFGPIVEKNYKSILKHLDSEISEAKGVDFKLSEANCIAVAVIGSDCVLHRLEVIPQ